MFKLKWGEKKGNVLENNEYWIWLSKVKISPISKFKLIQKYKSPIKLWNLSEEELAYNLRKSEEAEMLKQEYRNNLQKELNYINKYKIKLIDINNEYYPNNLKYIYDAPVVLYAIGNIELLKKQSIAIVGTRKCTDYGKKVAQQISSDITKYNANVISGLAKGIDSYAHIGSNGKTIAVLGTGVDIIYPKENISLAKEILNKGGLIISEYPIKTEPEKRHFPSRNRIISGIADSVIVVEATEKSGSLITAEFALEQGKNVYAVPGNITSIYSVGTNNLIKEGAIPFTGIDDILK